MRITSPAGFTRATAIIAIKYSLVERPEKIDEILHPEIPSFLMLIQDQDRVILCYLLFRNDVSMTMDTKCFMLSIIILFFSIYL